MYIIHLAAYYIRKKYAHLSLHTIRKTNLSRMVGQPAKSREMLLKIVGASHRSCEKVRENGKTCKTAQNSRELF